MMLGFDTISGNDALKASLRTALNRRFPQAVLLSGPQGSGTLEFAQAIAAALLCTSSDTRPCGACPSCLKLAHGTHPDLICLNEGDAEIKVEHARNIRAEATILPNDGSRKVFILHGADHMNTSAQNALLKVLEEPPRYTFFLLTATQPELLLPTIRSRCTIYQLAPQPVPVSDDSALLESVSAFMSALQKGDEYALLLAAHKFSKLNKTIFRQAMELVGIALRDAALYKLHAAPLLPSLHTESCDLPVQKLLAVYDLVSKISYRAEGNASIPLQCAVLAADTYRICCPPRD
ncbi:MAG: hypothetical protein Q4A63_05410 [Butyricicoccus pullicaecorum]|nr:hypothetical protein [Butyricicoccus pullicaecorum]MDO4669234.1 hypothetical protein [Butyricicoccus pullicaecorum]